MISQRSFAAFNASFNRKNLVDTKRILGSESLHFIELSFGDSRLSALHSELVLAELYLFQLHCSLYNLKGYVD